MKLFKLFLSVLLLSSCSSTKPFMLSQLLLKYGYQAAIHGLKDGVFLKNNNPIDRNLFYPLSVLTYLAETKIEFATPHTYTKLQNYNPVLKGHSNIMLERIFQRLLIIRRIKALIEEKIHYPTQWHIDGMQAFNAFALKGDHGPLVFITEKWLTSEDLTEEQFEKHLTAILFHELGHVFLNHTRTQHYIANTLILIAINAFLYSKDIQGKMCLPWELAAVIVEAAASAMVSRHLEFQADAFAAQFVPGSDLTAALEFVTGKDEQAFIVHTR